MKFKYQREVSNEWGMFGTLTCDTEEGKTWGVGENNLLEGLPILAGIFKLSWHDSNAEGYRCPILNDVPDHDNILLHKGNFPNHNPYNEDGHGDSKGCCLIGDIYEDYGTGDGMQVVSSANGFDELLIAIANSDPDLEDTTIEILDA